MKQRLGLSGREKERKKSAQISLSIFFWSKRYLFSVAPGAYFYFGVFLDFFSTVFFNFSLPQSHEKKIARRAHGLQWRKDLQNKAKGVVANT